MQVTMERVNVRFAQFVEKYRIALKFLNYSEADIGKDTAALERRLAAHDFKLYGSHPVHYLHGGKRITRFLVKQAIEYSPAARARRERLAAEYRARIAQVRVQQPLATFFSFEAAYAAKLRVDLSAFRALFVL